MLITNFKTKLPALLFISRRTYFGIFQKNVPIVNKRKFPNFSVFPSKFYISYTSKLCKKTADFCDVQNAKQTSTVIIDVRKVKEIEENGFIPGSINIELDDLSDVLANMSNEDFMKKYGRSKPKKDTSIIFHCRSGKRSNLAQGVATVLGYKNTCSYEGGFNDWKEKSQKQ